VEIATHLPSKKVLFLAWHVAAEHLHRCNDDDNDNENRAAELRIESQWMMVGVLELIILTMKWGDFLDIPYWRKFINRLALAARSAASLAST